MIAKVTRLLYLELNDRSPRSTFIRSLSTHSPYSKTHRIGSVETVGIVRSVGGGIQRLPPRIFHAESLVWIYLHGLGKKELLPHFFLPPCRNSAILDLVATHKNSAWLPG